MKIRLFVVGVFLSFFLGGFSQDKSLTMEDAVVGQWRNLYPEYLRNLTWRGETNQITWIDGNELMQISADGKEKMVLATLDAINASLYGLSVDSLRAFPSFKWFQNNQIRFVHKGQYFFYHVINQLIEEGLKLPLNAGNLEESKTGVLAFTRDFNIYLMDEKGEEVAVTNDGKYGLVYGESVHRNEFGINKGLYFSPESNYLAFYRMDESMVSDYPLVDVSKRVAELKQIKYPMAGMDSHEVSIGVYNIATGETNYLKIDGRKEQYLTSIAWTPDESLIYVGVLNRGQDSLQMRAYSHNGDLHRILFDEYHSKYVEPKNPPLFLPGKKNQFIWESDRDGFNQLYLYNHDGNLIKQLSQGEEVVTDVFGFDSSGSTVYFEASSNSGLDRHIYGLSVKSGKRIQITEMSGTNSAQFSSDKKFFINQFSSLNTPRLIQSIASNAKIQHTLLEAKNPLEEFRLGDMSFHTIKAADGATDLNVRLILPPNFEKEKNYPALIYVYGGPHAQLVRNTWLGGSQLWEFYMAQEGYVVMTLDNRGSANRGLEFENCIHRQLGELEVEDQLQGVQFLKALGYVDMERIGVHGWSYGGFMTINMMTKYPKVFKTGVAGGPVIDWKFYEIMYGERYMDRPQENVEGYELTSLLNKADKLEGKLLIIHGAMDDVVVWQHSQEFINACIKEGKQVDFFVYPQHKHNVRGMDRIHLMEKVSNYFNDYLR